ncbi:hypothetical protein PAPYR_4874 [Paratrimastix pyriformis]|uniref:Glycoside hydrolase family 5 domain-containing protein n=1 Tax=Paratrimastix pyriformis TaxID=342808 RepID=A0ABQ8URF9_9EUKA|nr:hypothetical protein PAPYR_4874 [Paratrimastix pyriformis]
MSSPLNTLTELEFRLSSLRGVNISSYSKNLAEDGTQEYPKPFEHFRPFDTLDNRSCLQKIVDLGFNCMRVLTFWECLEPQRGHYNETYIDELCEFVALGATIGLQSIVDFHQDLYSRRLVGSGAPDWALPPAVRAKIAKKQFKWWLLAGSYDHARPTDKTWGIRAAVDPDVGRSFDYFWKDGDGVRTAYCDMVLHVAKRLRGTPGLLAFDLINEPHTRSFLLMHGIVKSWAREHVVLAQFYEELVPKMAEAAGEGPLFFLEPYGMDSSLLMGEVGIKTPLALPPALQARSVWVTVAPAPRYHPWCVWAPHLYQPFSPAGPSTLDVLRTHATTAAKLGIPLFIGELGDLSYASGTSASQSLVRKQSLPSVAPPRFVASHYIAFSWRHITSPFRAVITQASPHLISSFRGVITSPFRTPYPVSRADVAGRFWNDEDMSLVDGSLQPRRLYLEAVAPALETHLGLGLRVQATTPTPLNLSADSVASSPAPATTRIANPTPTPSPRPSLSATPCTAVEAVSSRSPSPPDSPVSSLILSSMSGAVSFSPLSRLSLASLSPLSRLSLASLSPLSRLSLASLSPLSRLSLASLSPLSPLSPLALGLQGLQPAATHWKRVLGREIQGSVACFCFGTGPGFWVRVLPSATERIAVVRARWEHQGRERATKTPGYVQTMAARVTRWVILFALLLVLVLHLYYLLRAGASSQR